MGNDNSKTLEELQNKLKQKEEELRQKIRREKQITENERLSKAELSGRLVAERESSKAMMEIIESKVRHAMHEASHLRDLLEEERTDQRNRDLAAARHLEQQKEEADLRFGLQQERLRDAQERERKLQYEMEHKAQIMREKIEEGRRAQEAVNFLQKDIKHERNKHEGTMLKKEKQVTDALRQAESINHAKDAQAEMFIAEMQKLNDLRVKEQKEAKAEQSRMFLMLQEETEKKNKEFQKQMMEKSNERFQILERALHHTIDNQTKQFEQFAKGMECLTTFSPSAPAIENTSSYSTPMPLKITNAEVATFDNSRPTEPGGTERTRAPNDENIDQKTKCFESKGYDVEYMNEKISTAKAFKLHETDPYQCKLTNPSIVMIDNFGPDDTWRKTASNDEEILQKWLEDKRVDVKSVQQGTSIKKAIKQCETEDYSSNDGILIFLSSYGSNMTIQEGNTLVDLESILLPFFKNRTLSDKSKIFLIHVIRKERDEATSISSPPTDEDYLLCYCEMPEGTYRQNISNKGSLFIQSLSRALQSCPGNNISKILENMGHNILTAVDAEGISFFVQNNLKYPVKLTNTISDVIHNSGPSKRLEDPVSNDEDQTPILLKENTNSEEPPKLPLDLKSIGKRLPSVVEENEHCDDEKNLNTDKGDAVESDINKVNKDRDVADSYTDEGSSRGWTLKTPPIKIGTMGGKIEVTNCCITIPEGALDEEKEIEVEVSSHSNNFPEKTCAISPVLKCSPSISFKIPILVSIITWFSARDNEKVIATIVHKEGKDKTWRPVDVAALGSKNYIEFEITHFSCYAIAVNESDEKKLEVYLQNGVFIHSQCGTLKLVLCLDEKTLEKERKDMEKHHYRSVMPRQNLKFTPGDEINYELLVVEPDGLKATPYGKESTKLTPPLSFLYNMGNISLKTTYSLHPRDFLRSYKGLIELKYEVTCGGKVTPTPLHFTWPFQQKRSKSHHHKRKSYKARSVVNVGNVKQFAIDGGKIKIDEQGNVTSIGATKVVRSNSLQATPDESTSSENEHSATIESFLDPRDEHLESTERRNIQETSHKYMDSGAENENTDERDSSLFQSADETNVL